MRLDFNVLWIDDQPQNITGYVYLLGQRLEDEGFKLNVKEALSFAEAETSVADSVFVDNIDLVLVDYNLGAGEMGDVAVRKIRNRMPYKDIIFYSAEPTRNLTNMILAQGVEGVYCAHREELIERVVGVFNALIKKVLDIEHSRGIVMGVTSDIDQLVSECLVALESLMGQHHKDASTQYVIKNLETRLARFNKVREKLIGGMPMAEMLKSHEAVPAADKLKLLKKMMDLYYAEEHKELRDGITKYLREVPEQRNRLGHVRLVAKDTNRVLRGGEMEITAEEIRALRRSLIVYRDQFESLAKLVGVRLE